MDTCVTVTGRDIQSDNFKAMSAAKLSRQEQLVMNAVRLGHARRRLDLTNNEICLVMEEQLGRRVASNDISGRITELVTDGVLMRAESRACSVTGKDCTPVFAVAKQAELGLAVKATANAYGAAKARAAVDRRVAVIPQADAAPSSGMPPEVRARLAAIKAAATQGR